MDKIETWAGPWEEENSQCHVIDSGLTHATLGLRRGIWSAEACKNSGATEYHAHRHGHVSQAEAV